MPDKEPKIETVSVPMFDTGIGREAGFKDDAELLEAAKREREEFLDTFTPEGREKMRKLLEDAEADAERRFLFGEDATDA